MLRACLYALLVPAACVADALSGAFGDGAKAFGVGAALWLLAAAACAGGPLLTVQGFLDVGDARLLRCALGGVIFLLVIGSVGRLRRLRPLEDAWAQTPLRPSWPNVLAAAAPVVDATTLAACVFTYLRPSGKRLLEASLCYVLQEDGTQSVQRCKN